jgi:hypothetical protein
VRARRWLGEPDGDADYAAVHRQVANSDARPLGDLLKRTATALFLGRGLRQAGFEGGELVETALLTHLQSCSCNAYEISEHVQAAGKQVSKSMCRLVSVSTIHDPYNAHFEITYIQY